MKSISDSVKEYARGITGGLLFSLPLLYTMEVWWAGFSIQPYQLILYVAVTFLLLLGYNRFAGVHEGAGWKEVVIDSVEEIGIGFILSLIVLWNLGRIDFIEMGTDEIMGKIIMESMVVAIGVSIGTAQLGGDAENGSKENKEERNIGRAGHAVLAFCGSIIIAGNIAPTDEIPLLAMETSPLRLIAIVVESLLLGAVILFFSNFKGRRSMPNGMAFTVILETVTDYIIALISCLLMLWFYGRLNDIHFYTALSQVIILGFPAVLGASAGKILIKAKP